MLKSEVSQLLFVGAIAIVGLLLCAPAAVANEPRRCDVVFSIAQDGTLLWTKVVKQGCSFDEEPSVSAIRESAPFRPLPAEYGKHAEFLVSYDYWCTHRHDFSIQQVREEKGVFVPVGEKLTSCIFDEAESARRAKRGRFRSF